MSIVDTNKIAVTVLNWNSALDTMRCLDSLSKQTLVTNIILVDNNSTDDSVVLLEQYIQTHKNASIHFIKNPVNSGFTGGNNIGFRYALDKGCDYIGTLNPDAVADSSWVKGLIDELVSHTDTGIATGILARSDKKHLDTTGEQYSIWGIPSPRGRDSLLADAPKEAEYVFGSTGGGFIARAELLRDIGLFDEKFFMYFEDVDLSFRAQLAGYKVRYTPKAIAYHKLSASTNKVPGLAVYNTFKNLPMLFTKNVPFSLWGQIAPRFFLAYSLILGNAIAKGRGWPALKGFGKSIIYIPHAFRMRAIIQKVRKVSVKYIDSIILHDVPPEQTGLRKFRNFFVRSKKS